MRLSLRLYRVILLMGAGIFLFVGCGQDGPRSCNCPRTVMDSPKPMWSCGSPAALPAPYYTTAHESDHPGWIPTWPETVLRSNTLTRNSTISCASCHQQFAGFSHLDHDRSHGIDGLFGIRNAPSLANLIWKDELMWDGGVNNIEVQPIAAITNPVEIGRQSGEHPG